MLLNFNYKKNTTFQHQNLVRGLTVIKIETETEKRFSQPLTVRNLCMRQLLTARPPPKASLAPTGAYA